MRVVSTPDSRPSENLMVSMLIIGEKGSYYRIAFLAKTVFQYIWNVILTLIILIVDTHYHIDKNMYMKSTKLESWCVGCIAIRALRGKSSQLRDQHQAGRGNLRGG